jgi:hypothetical protein
MSMLDKVLARHAQECERLDANRWRLALSNGRALAVTAVRDEGFLTLDGETGIRLSGREPIPPAEWWDELPGSVKFAVRRGPRALRIRAEFPLPEDSGRAEERIGGHLDGMKRALHRLHEGSSREAAGGRAACPEDATAGQAGAPPGPGGLADLLKEAGWPCRERAEGALAADLEAGDRFLQAEAARRGDGVRFHVTLFRGEATSDETRRALCAYLLEANAALRYARAFLQREGETEAAGFEVCVEGEPEAGEAGHALAALSVAARQCAREMEVLKDGAVAGAYRLARGL